MSEATTVNSQKDKCLNMSWTRVDMLIVVPRS